MRTALAFTADVGIVPSDVVRRAAHALAGEGPAIGALVVGEWRLRYRRSAAGAVTVIAAERALALGADEGCTD